MKNRNLHHSDNWATPPDLYDKLNKEFNFDFDPCPINEGEVTADKDGLLIEWGQRNFVNPPYSLKLKEAFVLKAIQESKMGKLCVCLLPVSTSTKLFHDVIKPNAKEIRFLKRRVRFMGQNTKGEHVTTKAGMHDSMLVVFDGRIESYLESREFHNHLRSFSVTSKFYKSPQREIIRKIIELTAEEFNGQVWGHDTDLGTMDELINKGIEIVKTGDHQE